jgi:hypothetical protein
MPAFFGRTSISDKRARRESIYDVNRREDIHEVGHQAGQTVLKRKRQPSVIDQVTEFVNVSIVKRWRHASKASSLRYTAWEFETVGRDR